VSPLSRLVRQFGIVAALLCVVLGGMCAQIAVAQSHTGALERPWVTLLFGFASEGDSAAAIVERSLKFGAARSDSALKFEVVRCGSSYETQAACDTLMRLDGTRLIVFAGDEGSATIVAMMSALHHVPVLKLTSDPRTLTHLSSYFFEFLPCCETQSRVLGDFAVRYLGLAGAMVFTPRDAHGRALADGFKKGLASAGALIEVQRWYSPDAAAIRPDIDAMFADTARLAHGGTRLQSALSPAERAQVFGNAQSGEVLYAGPADSLTADLSRAMEGFYFALSPDRVDAYATQLPTLAPKTLLLGNSSWVDLDALERRETVTEGMYISLPLMPQALDTTGFVTSYQQTGAIVNEWALLGLDAGQFLGKVLVSEPRSRADVTRALADAPRMTGISAIVDFRNGHENGAARIVLYRDGQLRVVK